MNKACNVVVVVMRFTDLRNDQMHLPMGAFLISSALETKQSQKQTKKEKKKTTSTSVTIPLTKTVSGLLLGLLTVPDVLAESAVGSSISSNQ